MLSLSLSSFLHSPLSFHPLHPHRYFILICHHSALPFSPFIIPPYLSVFTSIHCFLTRSSFFSLCPFLLQPTDYYHSSTPSLLVPILFPSSIPPPPSTYPIILIGCSKCVISAVALSIRQHCISALSLCAHSCLFLRWTH